MGYTNLREWINIADEMGNFFSRTPVALAMALAMAAMGVTKGTFPTPRTP